MDLVRRRFAYGTSPLLSLRAGASERLATPEQDQAVLIASLLRHAVSATSERQSRRSLTVAARVARQMLSADELRDGPGFDEPGRLTTVFVLRSAADYAMRFQGLLVLADNMLASLAALVPATSLEGGRLLSQRAAASWFLGFNEVSAAQYRALLALGRRIDERELIARATHGLAHVRMSAGNFPAAERLARRAIVAAGKEYPRVACNATLKLGIVRALRGDFDGALAHAWRAYNMARRYEQGRQAALSNLAQMLLDAGYPGAARTASKHALRSPHPRADVFANLGTYATASAALNDTEAVEWAGEQVLALAKPPAFPQYIADGLLEVSFALEQVGRIAKARTLRRRAHGIATRHGYHDIAYLAETGTRRGKPRVPARITAATEAIATEVRQLEPESLPLVEVHAG